MATWKKVIVSGSNAILNQLNVGTTQQITPLASTTFLSGSFSGSFQGNFVGTTNLPDLTQGAGIVPFIYDGGATATVAVSGASSLNTNAITKWNGNAFANSSLTDNGTAITGTTSIQLTGANSRLSGSFSGSFQGDGTNLTGVTATPVFPSTAITNLASTDRVFVNDGANKHITYANLLTDLAGTNLVVEGNDSLALSTTITGITSITASSFTGSYTGSFTGPLTGTASWASSAVNVPTLKAGAVAGASFTLIGSEYQAIVTFGTPYPNTNYAISVVGENNNARSWTIESKGVNQFTINSNSDVALSDNVFWIATPYNN
jgi:hypothetical protein